MKIEIDIESNEVEIMLEALSYAMRHANQPIQEKLVKIMQEIQADISIEQQVFFKLRQMLSSLTRAPISRSSDLRHSLSINIGWINTYLDDACNGITQTLLNQYKPGKQAKRTTPAEAVKCDTVKDVVTLIQEKYEESA